MLMHLKCDPFSSIIQKVKISIKKTCNPAEHVR